MSENLVVLSIGSVAVTITEEELARGIERARAIVPAQDASKVAQAEPWLDAEGMANLTDVPATWWLDAARRGEIEHMRIGKYVRFLASKAAEALSHRPNGRGYQADNGSR